MTPEKKSFIVSPPREGNYETFPSSDETSSETLMKPASIKALAAKVLARNQQGNFNETCTKQRGNFSPENNPQKFHGFMGGNSNEITRPFPRWCRTDCLGLEIIPLPDEGEVAGCVHPITGSWRRLDRLTECPAMERKTTRPSLPEWCNSGCDCFCRLELPGIEVVQGCYQEISVTNWIWSRIDKMNRCPIATAKNRVVKT